MKKGNERRKGIIPFFTFQKISVNNFCLVFYLEKVPNMCY